jgi:hypothetical protein
MADRWFVPDNKVERMGEFDGRTIHARMWINERGRMGWAITTWTEDEPKPLEYWIANGEIYDASHGPDLRIGDAIMEMEQRKRNILLDAVLRWELEQFENART